MADANNSKAQESGSGGIAETVSQGVEYLQSVVTGTGGTGSSETSGTATGNESAKQESATSASASGSDIKDEHVAEFIRDRYKSQAEGESDQKDQ